VPPWARARDLDRDLVLALLERLHRLMAAARRTGWQASTGIQRSGEEAYVHARSGRPCRRCGDTVRVAMTGRPPRQRTLFSCPTCQGGLAPTDDGRPQRPLGSGRRRYQA
jgi:endonuclease-8